MSLMRIYYNPIALFDRLLDDALATSSRRFVSANIERSDLFPPRMDIHESKDANTIIATFELPGMKPDEITIDVHQDRLTIVGETKKSSPLEEGGYVVHERRYGKFSQTLRLPFATKPDNVKAKMENGVLTVTFPKTNPEQQAQRIAIQ